MKTPFLAFTVAITCGISLEAADSGSASSPQAPACAFEATGPGEFTFDTGILRGKLRAEGKSKGLSSVIHIPTGTRLDSSMGLFSFYRVFSSGKRYGVGAWDWPSKAALQPDGGVEVRWPAAEGRPFGLRARYRWAAADTLDLETIVEAEASLPAFECFLASYFTSLFTNSLVCAATGPSTGSRTLLAARESAGVWQTFPRDDKALALIQDGRWKIEPNPVDWVVRPNFAVPLAVRQAPTARLSAALLSRPQDCFAAFTPHGTESHYSMYLSLFGIDLKPGDKAVAKARLAVVASNSDGDLLKLYDAFATEMSR